MHCKKFGRRPFNHVFWEIFAHSDEEDKNFSENRAIIIREKISRNEENKQTAARLSSSRDLRFPISANKTFVVMNIAMLLRGYVVEYVERPVLDVVSYCIWIIFRDDRREMLIIPRAPRTRFFV